MSWSACSICLEDPFKDPRMMPCQHTLCKDCLQDYIDAKKQSGKFPCPLCQEKHDVKRASDFPNNKTLNAMDQQGSGKYSAEPTKMQIFLKTLNGKLITIPISGTSETIESVKRKVEDREGIKPEYQVLIFGGKTLTNGMRLKDYRVHSESTLQLVKRMHGGILDHWLVLMQMFYL